MTEKTERHLLIVDDEKGIRFGLRVLFERNGYIVHEASTRIEAENLIRSKEIDVVLLDVKLGQGESGMDVLESVQKIDGDIQVIMVTGYGSIDSAVKAIKRGASDYVLKPLDNDLILQAVAGCFKLQALQKENRFLKEELERSKLGNKIIYGDEKIHQLLNMADQVKDAATNILITGESGVGKEVLARYVHFTGNRKAFNFVSLNSAALSESLILSEMFGHTKGAFTGAHENKMGKIEMAHRGTLFLDEIGDMSLSAQAKLLRVLEERSFERLGGVKKIYVDIQLIAATNKDLKKLIEEGRFREDLYYRLNVITFAIPPLRERREDILPLAEFFIKTFSRKYHKAISGISATIREKLYHYDWPGNVRELQNIINRAVLLSPEGELGSLEIHTQPLAEEEGTAGTLQERLEPVISRCEREIILNVLKENNDNRTHTAEALGITRKTLLSKIQKYRIPTS